MFRCADVCSDGSLGVDIQLNYSSILSEQDKVAEIVDIITSLTQSTVSMHIGEETAVTLIKNSTQFLHEEANAVNTTCMLLQLVYHDDELS